ncbi:MAG: hypothetical protein IJN82_02825 [Clostridia bacterium]|nr:hypothetical protein [Clostridia bacterium]
MKLRKMMALLLAMLLLLCGCSSEEEQPHAVTSGYLYERMEVAQKNGNFFFAGEVLSAMTDSKQITYYEEQTAKNTFYQVEITNDPFGCMPERVVTVCVLGSGENFIERFALEEGEEYLFDTSLWVHEGAAVFLLPTFYENMPQVEDDALYYTDRTGKYLLDVDYATYLAQLTERAAENGYTPKKVLDAAKAQLEEAANDRTVKHFEELDFEKLDEALIKAVNRDAAALAETAEKTPETWVGIKELLA